MTRVLLLYANRVSNMADTVQILTFLMNVEICNLSKNIISFSKP